MSKTGCWNWPRGTTMSLATVLTRSLEFSATNKVLLISTGLARLIIHQWSLAEQQPLNSEFIVQQVHWNTSSKLAKAALSILHMKIQKHCISLRYSAYMSNLVARNTCCTESALQELKRREKEHGLAIRRVSKADAFKSRALPPLYQNSILAIRIGSLLE